MERATLPQTNRLPLKMVVSNRNLVKTKEPPFSGAFAISFREDTWMSQEVSK